MSEANSQPVQSVLLVDDNPNITALMMKYFAKAREVGHLNCKVLQATSGKEAYEIIMKQQPDVIISDIRMPDMDGFKLLKAFQTNYLPKNPFSVFCFVSASNEEKSKAMQMGVHGFVPKEEMNYFTFTILMRTWLRLAFLERSLQIKRELKPF